MLHKPFSSINENIIQNLFGFPHFPFVLTYILSEDLKPFSMAASCASASTVVENVLDFIVHDFE